jgi:VanZ family protein
MNRSDSRTRRLVILFAVMTLLITAFIWGNSLQSRAESSSQSSALAMLLKPLLDPFDRMDADSFHDLLRKAAHFVEFAILGLFAGGFTANLGKLRQRKYFCVALLITLTVAVADEYIQIFSGRGSMVSDVVLDYSGALAGLLLVVLCCLPGRKSK